jgi:hypothetical protein
MTPSPHIVLQEFKFKEKGRVHPSQVQLTLHGCILHVDEQLSRSSVLLSSHCSIPLFIPSPHRVEHELLLVTQGATQPSHEQFYIHVSILHKFEHPS